VVVHVERTGPGPVDDLVRVALGELGAGASGEVRHHCPSCGSSDHGRPWLHGLAGDRQIHLSVARCPGQSVVALTDAGPLGVDVERSGSARPPEVDQVIGSGPGDATRRWVRAEACLKATGRGFSRPAAPVAGRAWMSDLDVGEGFEAAVVVLAAAATEPELVVIQAAAATPSR
jgi:4'-phosphopantetheinyl transferase